MYGTARQAAAPVIPRTTLCLATTRDHALAGEAARRCAAICQFERKMYFSDRPWPLDGFAFHEIPKFRSLDDYNALILQGLLRHLETDHVLLAQYDGFVSNPSCWSDDFLAWDYIGAPWPQYRHHAVGNGGFSLRSRRLLAALRELPVETSDAPEDVIICRHWRAVLESDFGIRFAPPEVASRFSHEWGTPSGPTFGFHGLHHLSRHYRGDDAAWLLQRLQPEHFRGWLIIMLVLEYLGEGRESEAAAFFHEVCRHQSFAEIEAVLTDMGATDTALSWLFDRMPG
jgi:hypothetical protein